MCGDSATRMNCPWGQVCAAVEATGLSIAAALDLGRGSGSASLLFTVLKAVHGNGQTD